MRVTCLPHLSFISLRYVRTAMLRRAISGQCSMNAHKYVEAWSFPDGLLVVQRVIGEPCTELSAEPLFTEESYWIYVRTVSQCAQSTKLNLRNGVWLHGNIVTGSFETITQ